MHHVTGDGVLHRSTAMQRHKRAYQQPLQTAAARDLTAGSSSDAAQHHLCPSHRDLLKLYCFTCNVMVCRECVAQVTPVVAAGPDEGGGGGGHWQHRVQLASQVALQRRVLLSRHVQQLESTASSLVS